MLVGWQPVIRATIYVPVAQQIASTSGTDAELSDRLVVLPGHIKIQRNSLRMTVARVRDEL